MDDHRRPRATDDRSSWSRGYQRLGKVAAWVHREFHRRFMQVAAELGFTPKVAELQWWAVAKVAAVAGVAPDELNRSQVRYGEREQLIDATLQRCGAAVRAPHV